MSAKQPHVTGLPGGNMFPVFVTTEVRSGVTELTNQDAGIFIVTEDARMSVDGGVNYCDLPAQSVRGIGANSVITFESPVTVELM